MAKALGGTAYCDRSWYLVTASALEQRRKRSVFDPWCLHRWRRRVDGAAANTAVDEIADMVHRGSGRRGGDLLAVCSPRQDR